MTAGAWTWSASSSPRRRVVESFRNAAETIGPVVPGLSVFAITRGQFSMVDAILHCVEACAPARVSAWSWVLFDADRVAFFEQLATSGLVASGELFIDAGARGRNDEQVAQWVRRFGPGSAHFVSMHAKVATVEGNGLRVLLRGSLNFNNNPRIEQFDVTEGCAAFDVVRRVEREIVRAHADPVAEDEGPAQGVFAELVRWSQ